MDAAERAATSIARRRAFICHSSCRVVLADTSFMCTLHLPDASLCLLQDHVLSGIVCLCRRGPYKMHAPVFYGRNPGRQPFRTAERYAAGAHKQSFECLASANTKVDVCIGERADAKAGEAGGEPSQVSTWQGPPPLLLVSPQPTIILEAAVWQS
eukprot:366432-Chlamydomonas_euryale.AAC.9